MVGKEESSLVRKGPWTEQEDLQLVYSVGLFGDRRWDFIAKVSGLNRSGKSCRLRWVNYLHPDLKRGRMSPHEERLIVELHSRWGNRWSKIAKKLPGRTDNEIKNYWRTHMRKMAQEMKTRTVPTPEMYSPGCSTITNMVESSTKTQKNTKGDEGRSSLLGKGSSSDLAAIGELSEEEAVEYSMDQIWKEIASPEEVNSLTNFDEHHNMEEDYKFSCPPMASTLWDYCSDSLWKIDEENIKMGSSHHFIFN